jgi:hypothetical protein
MRTSKELNKYINELAKRDEKFASLWTGIKQVVARSHDFDINYRMQLVTEYLDKALESSKDVYDKDGPKIEPVTMLSFILASLWTNTLVKEELDECMIVPRDELEKMEEFNKELGLDFKDDNLS